MGKAKKQNERFIQMRADGSSYDEIARETGTDVQEVIDVVADRLEVASTMAAVKMEVYFKEQRIDNRGRIEQLSALRKRLLDEIETRDLSDVPTDKLVNLFIKTGEALKEEINGTPKILSTEGQAKKKYYRECSI